MDPPTTPQSPQELTVPPTVTPQNRSAFRPPPPSTNATVIAFSINPTLIGYNAFAQCCTNQATRPLYPEGCSERGWDGLCYTYCEVGEVGGGCDSGVMECVKVAFVEAKSVVGADGSDVVCFKNGKEVSAGSSVLSFGKWAVLGALVIGLVQALGYY